MGNVSPFPGQLAVATLVVLEIMMARNGEKENREASGRNCKEPGRGQKEKIFAGVCDRRPFLPYLKQDPADVQIFQDVDGCGEKVSSSEEFCFLPRENPASGGAFMGGVTIFEAPSRSQRVTLPMTEVRHWTRFPASTNFRLRKRCEVRNPAGRTMCLDVPGGTSALSIEVAVWLARETSQRSNSTSRVAFTLFGMQGDTCAIHSQCGHESMSSMPREVRIV